MSVRPDLVPDLARQLQHFADLATADELSTEELPVVQLLLAAGGSVSGRVFGVSDGRVLIGDADAVVVTTVVTSAIVGLQVSSSDATASLFGTPHRRRSDAPTKLELKRRIKTISDRISARVADDVTIDVPWADLPEGDAARCDLQELLDNIDIAFTDLTTDDLGAEALAGVTTVAVRIAPQVGVDAGDATITIGVRARGDRLVGPTELLHGLEAAL